MTLDNDTINSRSSFDNVYHTSMEHVESNESINILILIADCADNSRIGTNDSTQRAYEVKLKDQWTS
jgi:hypothetical protein